MSDTKPSAEYIEESMAFHFGDPERVSGRSLLNTLELALRVIQDESYKFKTRTAAETLRIDAATEKLKLVIGQLQDKDSWISKQLQSEKPKIQYLFSMFDSDDEETK